MIRFQVSENLPREDKILLFTLGLFYSWMCIYFIDTNFTIET